MSNDEDGTHARWQALRRDIVQPRVQAHRGHLVKTTGDGLLVEFGSVLDAVSWARDVQTLVVGREGEVADSLRLRIAVHLCDVIDDEADIWGEGVNVASRLQEHAPPGGILLSETVYDIARISTDLEARPLGPLSLKNIPEPVSAWVLDPPRPENASRGIETSEAPQASESLPHAGRKAEDISLPALSQALPSIAVLPLHNLSSDPEGDWFAEGIVEDIVVSLASLRELLVISRASTLSYGAARPDPQVVGRTFGVDYVLMGTVRRSPSRIKASVQLCDTHDGSCLWAEGYAVETGDLFDMQDEIVERVVAGIAPHVRGVRLRQALRKRPESVSAYDHALKALAALASLNRATFEAARQHLEQALEIDPGFAMADAWSARWYSLRVGQGWSDDFFADATAAERHARRALESDPRNAVALATLGHVISFLYHEPEQALPWLNRARFACPNCAVAWQLSSATHSYLGRAQEAIRQAERGLRLSPLDPWLFHGDFFLGLAHYSADDCAEAIKWCRLSRSDNPLYTANLRILAAALVGADRIHEAQAVAADLKQLEPAFSLTNYARSRQPFADPATRERLIARLRAAGLPD